MKTIDRYRAMQKELHDARASGELSIEREDALLDQMDKLWWELTVDERIEVDNKMMQR